MSLRIRYVRFFGVMAVLTVLLSVSAINCCTCRMEDGVCKKEGGGYPPTPAKVVGVVKDDANGNGVPDQNEAGIAGPQMILYNSSRSYIFIRNSDGTYQSPSVVPDTYTLKAEAAGYLTQSRSVTLSPGESKTQNFALQHQSQ